MKAIIILIFIFAASCSNIDYHEAFIDGYEKGRDSRETLKYYEKTYYEWINIPLDCNADTTILFYSTDLILNNEYALFIKYRNNTANVELKIWRK